MQNQKALVIPHKETGMLITMREITDSRTGDKREVGTVMVQSKSLSGLGALARVSTRTAFITLEADAIEFLGDSLKPNKPFPVDGKIVIEETLEPYVKSNGDTQEPKINPTTGETITHMGAPVYRNMYFTENLDQQDVYLTTDRDGVEAESTVEQEEDEVVE